MKAIPEELKTHIEGEVTSLCRCWILQTVSGLSLGFTDHDEDITLKGIVCERNAGFEASQIEERLGLDVNTTEVEGALQSGHITADDIHAGIYDNARVSTYVVNWQKPSLYMLDHVSLVGEIIEEDGIFKMEFRSLSSQLDQTHGRHFVKECQADLGDGNCRIRLDRPNFRTSASIVEILSPLVLRVEGIDTFESGWFRGGQLEWTSGQNKGERIEITEHISRAGSSFIHLWQTMPKPLGVADQFSLTTGCDKRFQTCKEKFSNALNFYGFPHMPGNDFITTYAANANNFDGEPIIP